MNERQSRRKLGQKCHGWWPELFKVFESKYKVFDFYSEWIGELMHGFEQRIDIFLTYFLKHQSSWDIKNILCRVKYISGIASQKPTVVTKARDDDLDQGGSIRAGE